MQEKSSTRLFVFDVDGTLLNSSHELLPSTRAALQILSDAGHYIVLATARPPGSVARVAAELAAESPISIALNGAMIVEEQKTLWEKPLAGEPIRRLIQEARRRGLHINLMSGWDWFVEVESKWSRQEAEIVRFKPTVVADLLVNVTRPVHKVLIMGEPEKIDSYRNWAKSMQMPIQVTLSKPTYCEIVEESVSKARAVRQIAQQLEISVDDIIAFGDGENDMAVMQLAGIGVAMGNAMPRVTEAADFVTKTNDENGIAHALVRLGFIAPEFMAQYE